MSNLYLIGFMGSGKTSVATYLERTHGIPRIEMDRDIEADCGQTIDEIFATEGEDYFRAKETLLLKKITEKDGIVVSCGGGVPLRQENVALMKKSGTIVYLAASPEIIWKRVRHSQKRPLLKGFQTVEEIAVLMQKRQPIYEAAADVRLDVDAYTVSEIGTQVKAIFNSDLL